MITEQARRIITAHDNADRALQNLRNAGAMSTDDPRATEMLESAGDAFAETLRALYVEQNQLVLIAEPASDAPSAAEKPAKDSEQEEAPQSPLAALISGQSRTGVELT